LKEIDYSRKILEASKELFFRYGIKSITMDDISRNLGMSKKTIYQFFPDKNQLVLELTGFVLEENDKEFCGINEKAENPVEEIIELMKHMESMFSKMNPVLFYDMMKYHRESWDRFRTFKQSKITSMVEENLRKGVESGLYRKDINIKILAKMRVEMVEMALNQEIFPSDKFNIAEVQKQFIESFLYGVCTLKGHKLINKYKNLHEDE
jgi:TetR/AcrR family transcriptional regulator, cholesterol catabolism regulator